LNHTWFQADAAQALPQSKLSSIYATSYKATGKHFPLVWAPEVQWVNAVNVTKRYVAKSDEKPVRLMVRVWKANPRERVAADVTITAQGFESKTGRSRDTSFDTNDILAFEVVPNKSYKISVVSKSGASQTQSVKMNGRKEKIVDVTLSATSGR
jgi:hypothetical protein